MAAVSVAMTAGLLVACGPGRPDITTAQPSEFTIRATAVAQAWNETDQATHWGTELALLDDPTRPPTDVDMTIEQESAFRQGRYRLDTELPDTAPPTTVTWDDGTTDRPARDARDAWRELATDGEPPHGCEYPSDPAPTNDPDSDSDTAACHPLTVTSVTIGTATRWTNHGPAEYPVWELTVAGLSAPVTTLAVVDEPIRPTPVLPGTELDEVYPAMALESMSGTDLTFAFTTGTCVEDEAALVHETDDVVIVAGTARDDGSRVCTEMAVRRPVTAQLTEPLGDRMVIDAVTATVVSAAGQW